MNIRIFQLCLTILLAILSLLFIFFALSGVGSLFMRASDSDGITAITGGITSRLIGDLLLIAGAIILVILIARLWKKGT